MMEYTKLPNGAKMPKIGLGLWKGGDTEMEGAIYEALEAGYRLFDTAFLYGTEDILGKAIQKWIKAGKGKREDLFIITKLPWNGMQPHMVEHFINLSLKELGLTYIDLYLIHNPFGIKYTGDRDLWPTTKSDAGTDHKTGQVDLDLTTDLEAIWKAMEVQVDKGKARDIGLSNFTAAQTERIVKVARIPPANNQIEIHAYFQQKELIRVCAMHSITVTAHSPLGAPWQKTFVTRGDNDEIPAANFLLDDPVVKSIAVKHGKTAGQILLKFLLHLGVSIVPKSSKSDRIKENIDLFCFNLDASDLQKLEALDKTPEGRVMYLPFDITAHPENPF